ncbi:MAG: mechanosensitive ion channel family protein, partial [Deltaproteobacteria bacterium]|nr:mechanosensitive ion channel family protein [Deltaproteobacteria bacterium]
MQRLVVSLLVCVALLSTAAVARAGKSIPTCANPRNAADSVFLWQLGDQQSLKNAARCFERTGRNATQLEEAARRLKLVYDAEGAFVEIEKIPDDANYLDDNKNTQVTPHADLPEVVIRKQGDKWLWSKASLDHIDKVYADKLGGVDQFIEKLPTPLKFTVFDLALWQYLALLLLVLSGLVVRKLIQAVVAARIKRIAKRLNQQWTIKFVDVIASPGATLVTAIILRVGYPQLRLPISVSGALATTVRVLITLSVVWAIYRAVDLLAAKLSERADKTESKLDDQLVPLLRKSLKVVVFILGGLVVLQNLKFDVTTLLASVSIGTLAFGLAAKDTIANLFGSISIFVDNPFQIGDWICVDKMHGTVEEVGFRSTRIRTFYNSVLVIPNAKLADAKIDNYGQRQYRRCFITLGVTYDTTPEQMQALVEGCRAL